MRECASIGTVVLLAFATFGACAGGGDADGDPGGSGGTAGSGATGGSAGGSGGSAGAGAAGGAGGAAGTGAGGAGGSAGAAGVGGGSGASGSAGSAGSTGTGGGPSDASADAPPGWPTCDAKPATAAHKTLPQIWADDPSAPTEVWVTGTYVTAISGGACTAGDACQIYLQQDPTYASFALGAHRAIKLRVSGTAAQYFTALAPGDQVDVLGHAWRFNLGGANELVIQVNAQLQGCAKKIGTGAPAPITGIQLSDLNVTSYELTHGPLLIQVAAVSGKPAAPAEIFGIWPTGVGIGDASPSDLVSISPFFLPAFAFTGLPTNGQTTVSFQTVTGVFGQYIPATETGTPPKYHVIYPRSMADLVQ
jgi:hypothetical protein